MITSSLIELKEIEIDSYKIIYQSKGYWSYIISIEKNGIKRDYSKNPHKIMALGEIGSNDRLGFKLALRDTIQRLSKYFK